MMAKAESLNNGNDLTIHVDGYGKHKGLITKIGKWKCSFVYLKTIIVISLDKHKIFNLRIYRYNRSFLFTF